MTNRIVWPCPPHAAGLTLERDPHLDNGPQLADAINDGDFAHTDWVSDDERDAAIRTNRCWVLHWYPNTPVGFCSIAASSTEALIAYFRQENEPFTEMTLLDPGHSECLTLEHNDHKSIYSSVEDEVGDGSVSVATGGRQGIYSAFAWADDAEKQRAIDSDEAWALTVRPSHPNLVKHDPRIVRIAASTLDALNAAVDRGMARAPDAPPAARPQE